MKLSFTAQILLAMVMAIVLGLAFQFTGSAAWAETLFAPGGKIFLNLIKFIVFIPTVNDV